MRTMFRNWVTAIAVVTLLATMGSSAVVGRSVTNGFGSNVTAQVVWGTGDETGGHFGGIYGDIEEWGTVVGLFEDEFTIERCDAGTPADPSDDYDGYVGTYSSGDGEGTVTVSRDLGSATVSGTITVYEGWQDDCAQTAGTTSVQEGVTVALELHAVAHPTSFRDHYHELLAAAYNSHGTMISRNREADGSAFLNGEPYAFDSGLISKNRWSYHDNAK